MTETSITTRMRVRLAGLICMLGGMSFSLYFIGLNSLLDLFSPPLEPGSFATVKLFIWLATCVCLAGGPIGLLALNATVTGWKKVIAIVGAIITLMGLGSYAVGSIYIYISPDKALRQFFTPAGSALITLGMLMMAMAVLKARKILGWRAATPLLLGLYFPLQFPLQTLLFLGKGRGPNPMLLGAWGFFWLLLGYAIRSRLPDVTAAEAEPKSQEPTGQRRYPPDVTFELEGSVNSPDNR